MQKKLISMLCAIFFGLFFYSCSDPILPKRVEIKGGAELPARIGVADFGTVFREAIQTAFSGGAVEVFDVVYEGQTVQTFCINLPMEMTEDLNPNAFLKTINRQINNGISADPLQINPVRIPLPETAQISTDKINWPTINPVDLGDIAGYVNDITFGEYKETVESGIGINFYLEEIVVGLEMKIQCEELNFSDKYIPLQKGDNIFYNSDEVTLALNGNNSNKLTFKTYFKSTGPGNTLNLTSAGLKPGAMVTLMKGEVRFFQNWTKATIDMKNAIRAADKKENYVVGTFPEDSGGFNFSGLGDFLDGDFIFDGLESKMYMNNPVGFPMHLELNPEYTGKHLESEKLLYNDAFSVDKEPFVLSSYLKDGNYPYEHLPGIIDDNVDESVIADILGKMPIQLIFQYTLTFTKSQWTIKPEMFRNSDEHSSINMSLLIMLPLHLIAATDGSVINLPDIFEESGDLFGRDEVDENGYLFGSVKVKKIKMTVNFLNPIFSSGYLFIDGDRNTDPLLFYPDGVKLNGKRIIMDFTASQMEIVQDNLIKPNFWIKLEKDDTVTFPTNMGLSGIKFEMNGIINVGDLFE